MLVVICVKFRANQPLCPPNQSVPIRLWLLQLTGMCLSRFCVCIYKCYSFVLHQRSIAVAYTVCWGLFDMANITALSLLDPLPPNTHTQTHRSMHVCVYVCMCVCMRVRACVYVCMYVRTYVCMYVCMYVCR